MDFQTIMQSAFMTGAVAGLVSAAVVDFAAFRSWKSMEEAAAYAWGVAAWRWAQGFIGGGLAATVFQTMA